MIIQAKILVYEVYKGERLNYVSGVNMEKEGGQLKLSFPKEILVNVAEELEFKAKVKPGIGRNGLYLEVVEILK